MNKIVGDGKWIGVRERSERCCRLLDMDILGNLVIIINDRVDEEFE